MLSLSTALKQLALTASLSTLGFVASCSGRTDEAPPKGNESLGGSDTSSTAGGASGPLTPTAGGADSDSMGGEGSMPSMPDAPLQGAAFFDFDCSPDGELPEGNACANCEVASCSEELAAALGEQWISGTANGPCQGWFECVQACPCNDQQCYRSCTSLLGEGNCEVPFLSLDACVTENCQDTCVGVGTG